MFAALRAELPDRQACKTMVALLALAHERACEAELASLLEADLTAKRLPDLDRLRARFAPDPARLPSVHIQTVPLSDYHVLLKGAAATSEHAI
jgi:hypothetical protein